MPEKEYQISVITPFHNVDIKMFRYAYESLRKQTLGFRNIEWIVVLHNTDGEYRKAVHEMLDSHENVM
ncbi:MAG: glycosyltransferase family 2 protein, partial [Selenomonadaceae bacterium]|nr:glycosyltransferase family 2 protein [Selenomonadaceae bacterium]